MVEAHIAVNVKGVLDAQLKLSGVVEKTPLNFSMNLSEELKSSVFLKREDMQVVRSYSETGKMVWKINYRSNPRR